MISLDISIEMELVKKLPLLTNDSFVEISAGAAGDYTRRLADIREHGTLEEKEET